MLFILPGNSIDQSSAGYWFWMGEEAGGWAQGKSPMSRNPVIRLGVQNIKYVLVAHLELSVTSQGVLWKNGRELSLVKSEGVRNVVGRVTD